MMLSPTPASTSGSLGRAVAAGIAGTGVMTAFQKFVEMPLTGRQDSYAPGDFAEKVLPGGPAQVVGRYRLNLGTHFALGGMWGAAYGAAARRGLRGPRAIAIVSVVVYSGDVLLNAALGLYEPRTWSRRDWTVDVVDKLVQSVSTSLILDHVLDPVGRR